MSKPLIMVSNDDGAYAPGIEALAKAMTRIGDVVVVAPERERSAVSHAISLHKPLRLHNIRPGWYACSGTPADCVYIGLNHILEREPDLVVSGINSQLNIGDDVTYSGTAACAREAALMDCHRAVAFSANEKKTDYDAAANAAVAFCEALLATDDTPDALFYNVNFPAGVSASTGWRLTRLGDRNYGRLVTRKTDPRGRDYFWIGGDFLGFGDIPGSDANAVRDGFISATPVPVRPTGQHPETTMSQWPLFKTSESQA